MNTIAYQDIMFLKQHNYGEDICSLVPLKQN